MKKFKTGVAYKRLTYKTHANSNLNADQTHANSNLNADQSNFFAH